MARDSYIWTTIKTSLISLREQTCEVAALGETLTELKPLDQQGKFHRAKKQVKPLFCHEAANR